MISAPGSRSTVSAPWSTGRSTDDGYRLKRQSLRASGGKWVRYAEVEFDSAGPAQHSALATTLLVVLSKVAGAAVNDGGVKAWRSVGAGPRRDSAPST